MASSAAAALAGSCSYEPFAGHKPFLGGFRDKRTQLEYHDAYTQACLDPRPQPWELAPPKFSRDTQTSSAITDPVSRSTQSKREGAAQTAVRGLHQSTTGDRVLVPRAPYFSSEMKAALWERMAIVIQKHWRASCGRAEARALRGAIYAVAEAREEAARAAAAAAVEASAADLERRLHPRTPADFAVLYDEVEAWRVATTERIHAEVPKEHLTQAFSEMLAKETALIGTIERLRAEAARANKEASIERRLGSMAEPQKWPLSHVPKAARKPLVAVTTPLTVRAAELKRLYDALGLQGLCVEDRTEVLLHVKYTVAEVDCKLSRELVGLLDRELDLLARGRPDAALAALRSRIRTLFLAFCDTPEFNPLVAKQPGLPGPGRNPRTQATMLRTQTLPPGGAANSKARSFMVNREGEITGRRGGGGGGGGGEE
jgi:hypothetical protein